MQYFYMGAFNKDIVFQGNIKIALRGEPLQWLTHTTNLFVSFKKARMRVERMIKLIHKQS